MNRNDFAWVEKMMGLDIFGRKIRYDEFANSAYWRGRKWRFKGNRLYWSNVCKPDEVATNWGWCVAMHPGPFEIIGIRPIEDTLQFTSRRNTWELLRFECDKDTVAAHQIHVRKIA